MRLREAAVDGRISADELDERLGCAFAATTYGELDRLIVDLPLTPAPGLRTSVTPVRRLRSQHTATASLALVVLVLDLLVVDRWEALMHEAGGMSAGRVMSAVGVAGLAHATEAVIGALCVLLALFATVGWALARPREHAGWSRSRRA